VRLYLFRWYVGTWIIQGLLHPLAEPYIMFWVYGCYLRRRNKQGDGVVFAIDDDLRARAYMNQYSGKVANRFGLRDVNYRHKKIIPPENMAA
jgi:hypothetical protein